MVGEQLGYLLLGIGLISLMILLVAYQSVLLRLRSPRTRGHLQAALPVTVLKPLKGVDPGLYDNLRAIVEQDHPNFEVILGAEDPEDPALVVARKVAQEYPGHNIRVVCGGVSNVGVNPKVRILSRLVVHAQHDWVLISDSNVRPPQDYLTTMVAVQEETGADLVHTILSGCAGESTGARLEELQLNGWVAATICFAQRFGHPCVIGKSMLLRKSYLTKERALMRMRDILAEDYTMGAEMRRLGREVALAPYLLPVVTGGVPVGQFLNRHIRWGQMRRQIAPLSFLMELFANPTPFLLASLCFVRETAWELAVGAQLLKWTLDVVVYTFLSQRPSVHTAALIPLKDLLTLFMWGVSALKRTVVWRGTVMRVGPGSRLELRPATP